ncbi:MAG: DUF3793 family protein [Caloramator sp.]|nr:DUF3793 family protein [Caloramator sp.]
MIVFNLFHQMKNYDYRTYIISQIVYYASPTIFSSKPSTIINFNNIDSSFYKMLPSIKAELQKNFRLYTYELFKESNRCLVLFYKKELLLNVFRENISFLSSFGYKYDMTLNQILNLLKEKYALSCPHEIGIFLGIPKEDVVAFMTNNKNFKLCGYWKVYSDEEKAKRIFAEYDRAKNLALNFIYNEYMHLKKTFNN